MRGFGLDKLLHCISSITDYKEKEKHDKDSEDIISGLPDDVLRLILSSLQFKDAFAMSLLSRRWRYLWSSLSSLNFDCIETYVLRIMVKKKSLKKERQKLIKFVNNAVGYYQGVTLEEFMVTFPLDNTCASAIDKWVEFSLSKKVQKLVLNFHDRTILEEIIFNKVPQDYHFPNQISTLSFISLKELDLHRVAITHEDIQYILSTALLLERLALREVYSLFCFRVTNPSLVLKSLEIVYCPLLQDIEIRDINLVSLQYYGYGLKSMVLRNLPLLVEIKFGMCNLARDFVYLPCFSSQLEILSLVVTTVKRVPVVDVFPQLFKLKRLVLNIDLPINDNLGLIGSLLRASPCLQTLKLELRWECTSNSYRTHGVRSRTRLDCGHDCLTEVELAGYNGGEIVHQLAIHMFDTFVLLQKMVIDPRHQSNWRFQYFGPKWIKETHNMRELAKQQLKGKNPSGVDLVFL